MLPTTINFPEFLKKWKVKQNTQLNDLVKVSKISNPPAKDSTLSGLVQGVMAHYQELYKVRSLCARTNVFLILSPSWSSALEEAFTWVGGWRPSTAFHIVYSVSGLQLKSKLDELVNGEKMCNLGGLSSSQVVRIDALQRMSIKEEREITEELAEQQEKVADAEMIELSHSISKSLRENGVIKLLDMNRVELAMKPKEEGFQKVLQRADDLRMRTLEGIIENLSPIQGVCFLIGVAELQLRLHDWGREKELRRANHGSK